jgi:hypothetical protein
MRIMAEGCAVMVSFMSEERLMSGYAKQQIDTMEQRLNEPVSPEEMDLRRQLVAELRARKSRPVTEEEREFWRKFDEDLNRERPSFR